MSLHAPLMFLRPACGPSYRPLGWLRMSKMPLKAKITNPAFTSRAATMSTSGATIPKELPEDDPDDVIFNSLYGARTIELNRPQKLNSLNASMARKIIPRLLEWQKSQMANIIIIGGAGPKAFCAGGDVAALAQSNTIGPSGRAASQAYFGLEYQLDHLIATYQKPYVAYMDGITMGGGVGLSVHAPIRIATERTVFAMPETSIGLFPDVGGSFFLPRLDGSIGTYLALTSERLKGANAFYAGIATHYIDSSILPNLTARLAELPFKDYDDLRTRLTAIAATIAEFSTGLPPNEPPLLSGPLRAAIDRVFSKRSLEAIIKALESETRQPPSPSDPSTLSSSSSPSSFDAAGWARQTLQTLSTRSPTSLKVTLQQLHLGAQWDIAETFEREYHLAGAFMHHPDFTAGVTARLINKPATTPTWSPATLADVTPAAVEKMVTPPAGARRLDLLGPAEGAFRYKRYPFQFGLPAEDDVARVVREGGQTPRGLVKHFERDRVGGDVGGVAWKVLDVLQRRCRLVHDGREDRVEWVG